MPPAVARALRPPLMHGSVPAGDIDVLRHAGHRRLPDSSACSVWAGNGQIPWKTLWRESAARVSGGREIDFTMWPLPRPHERAPRGSVHAERCPGEGEGDTSGGDVVHSVRSGPSSVEGLTPTGPHPTFKHRSLSHRPFIGRRLAPTIVGTSDVAPTTHRPRGSYHAGSRDGKEAAAGRSSSEPRPSSRSPRRRRLPRATTTQL